MADSPDFDFASVHRHFAAQCFNDSWALITKASRTSDEDEALVALGHASLWHWSRRPDCTDKNLSIGYWLLARIYCVTSRVEGAERYAKRCLELSQRQGVPAYYLGCAHEACARAASIRRDAEGREEHLRLARRIAETLDDAKERKKLTDDLATIATV
jgi:hypothetical protein